MTFNWPDTIIYDGRQVKCNRKMPNFAEFMLPAAYMNRTIYISRDEWVRYQKKNNHWD
jgi:hypothetical protein